MYTNTVQTRRISTPVIKDIQYKDTKEQLCIDDKRFHGECLYIVWRVNVVFKCGQGDER